LVAGDFSRTGSYEPNSVDFFVSYTLPDVAWATWVGTQLEASGYKVRLQTWDAPAGQNFVTWTDEQIRAATWIVALCSPEYVKSRWCIQEWTGGLAHGKVIPLRIAECFLPPTLATIGWRDLFGLDEDEARDVLLQAVGRTNVPRIALHGFPGRRPVRAGATPFPGLPGVWNVPGRLANFTGRDDTIDALRKFLVAPGSARRVAVVQTAALHGLGGVGKTQLAIEYAYRYAKEYGIVWWVDAEQTSLVGDQLAQLGARLGLARLGQVEQDASAALEVLRRSEDWLIIFDNAPDLVAIRKWLPAGAGHVLLTSRSSSWGQAAAAFAIDVFRREESVAFLVRRLGAIEATTARRLAAELGDLPLALEQAAAYIEQTKIFPGVYLERFRTQRQTMLGKGYDLAYDGTVDTCWTLSVQKLDEGSPAASALLDICCQLASEPIPLFIFQDQPELLPAPLKDVVCAAVDPAASIDEIIGLLLKYSLVSRLGNAVTVHRLVAAVVRAHRPSARDVALRLLIAATASQPEDPANWPSWTALAPHLVAAPALSPRQNDQIGKDSRRLMFLAARYFVARGDISAASALDKLLYECCGQLFGKDHAETLAAANNVAADLHMAGEFDAARILNEQTLDHMRHSLGEDHPDTLACSNNLASDLRALAAYQQAHDLDKDTLARKRKVLGADHPHTLTSASNLGADLRALAEHEEARVVYEDILARRTRLLGEDHSHTLITARSLAADLRALGLEESAKSIEDDAIERRRHALGVRHGHALVSSDNLARDLHALDEHQISRVLDEDTLERSRRAFGDEHFKTLVAAGNLARDLHAVGELQAARLLDEDTLARSRRLLGDDHPHTITMAANLARDLHALGEHDAAREWEDFAQSHGG
jgi:hypothetical protein